MFSIKRLPFSALLIVLISPVILAQGFSVGSKSPPSVKGAGTFISLQGRFSIALPQDFHGFTPVSANSPAGRITGDSYNWTMKEGSFTAGYIDRPELLEEPAMAKRMLDFMRDGLTERAKPKSGKFAGEKSLSGIGHPGREIRLEFPDGSFVQRVFLVSKRMYLVSVTLHADQRTHEADVITVLDSFKILNPADIEAVMKAKIADATPEPLPQTPVAPKDRSDAEDEGLKGRIRTTFDESEDLSGTWAVGGRIPSSKVYYNESGNRTRADLYDWKGNLFDITVYGYLDGARVAHSKTIRHEYDPPPMIVATAPDAEKPKYDPRYSRKTSYKYDDKKRLVEETMYNNSGKLSLKYVYKYIGNQTEEFVYLEDGKLNQHYLSILDERGNEIERISFETGDGSMRSKNSYAYEFDNQGNWIKQTTSKWSTKDGRSYYQPSYVNYRTITYY